jgi:hypothetical protein
VPQQAGLFWPLTFEGEWPLERKRRRLPRYNADWPGKYTIEGVPGGAWGACDVLDISILGAGLELFGTTAPELVGREILVEVTTPAGSSITLQMVGKIGHSGPGRRGGIRVGVEFGGLSEMERAILNVLEQMQAVW